MSCDISRGRLEPCKDSVGGLNAVYFVNKGAIALTDVTYDVTDADVIASVGTAVQLISLMLKEHLPIQKTSNLQERMELLLLNKY